MRRVMTSRRWLLCAWIGMLGAACDHSEAAANDQAPRQLVTGIQDLIAESDASTERYYDEVYRHEEVRFWTKIPGWMFEDWVERYYTPRKPAGRILDLGCGYGTLLAVAGRIYGAEGFCVDVIRFLPESLEPEYGVSYIKGDVERGPLPGPEKFDVIIMTEVLEHFNFKPIPTLRKIRAALADGGSFFLSTPDADTEWGRTFEHYRSLSEVPDLDPNAEWIDGHIWQYNEKELTYVVEEAGFEIKRLDHSRGSSGGHFNVWLTTRSANSKRLAPELVEDPAAELQIRPPEQTPFYVYQDDGSPQNHYAPSGVMGDHDNLKVDDAHAGDPHSGRTSLKIVYDATGRRQYGWAALKWQNPPLNTGQVEGAGYNLVRAKKLTFWARGEKGGETIDEFAVGGTTGAHPDTAHARIGRVVLTREWKQYAIDLGGKNLRHISGGFQWGANANLNPEGVTFYLDEIRYE